MYEGNGHDDPDHEAHPQMDLLRIERHVTPPMIGPADTRAGSPGACL
jgi:hypothetical protein